MELMRAIMQRQSVRQYKADQVPENVLEEILRAGLAAPVGRGNHGGMHLTVVQNSELLKKISDGAANIMQTQSDPTYAVPSLIIISAKENVPGADHVAAGCIAENMLLAATGQSIGGVILWYAANAVATSSSLRTQCGIPEGYEPRCCVGLGYAKNQTSGERSPERKTKIGLNRV